MSDCEFIVTEEYIDPNPQARWVCEACKRSYEVGDLAYGREIGTDTCGDFVCEECHRTGEPIIDDGTLVSRLRHTRGTTLVWKGPRLQTT